MKRIRAYDGMGRLRVHQKYHDGDDVTSPKSAFLPEVNNGRAPCVQNSLRLGNDDHVNCFETGDHRASEHLTLSAIHTLWLREHNLIANELSEINPHWGEETLYQETRNIIIGFHQAITYNEYYPAILGQLPPTYQNYNSSINPSVSTQFATASFRFGHAQIHPMVMRLGPDFNQHPDFESLLLHRAFFQPWRIIDEGGIDPLIRGLIAFGAKTASSNNMMSDQLRQKLFAITNKVGLDLASINLQRGRDHGLPLYNEWLEFCGFEKLESFDDLELADGSEQLRQDLENLYGHPGNMDLWLAGLLEPHLSNAAVGKTNSCLIKKQFLDVRDGDRFWYQNTDPNFRIFSDSQISQIDNYKISSLICRTTGLNSVQINALLNEERVSCNSNSLIPALNLNPWRESLNSRCAENPENFKDIDSTMISYKLCSSDQNLVLFSCRYSGYEFSGASQAVCDPQTGTMQFNSEMKPICLDLDECSTVPNICNEKPNHICRNVPGSFICEPSNINNDLTGAENFDTLLRNMSRTLNSQKLALTVVAIFSSVIAIIFIVALFFKKLKKSIWRLRHAGDDIDGKSYGIKNEVVGRQ